MNATAAIKRPFQNLKALVIGVIVMLIPIINFTIGFGYVLRCAKSVIQKNYKMPRWNDIWDMFVKGILAVIIALIYAIPVFIALIWTLGTAFLAAGLGRGFVGTFLAAFGTFSIGILITGIVIFIISLILPIAILRFVDKEIFGVAFELKQIFKKAFTANYFVAWLFATIYCMVVCFILAFIPIIGIGIGLFIGLVTYYTILAEAYVKK